jgi:succinoglycan biosynthesis protein ExoA
MKARVLHLRASNFVGGPEKQILAYARESADIVENMIGSFCGETEGAELLRAAASQGFATLPLPAASLTESVAALKRAVRESNIQLICTHGYKSAVLAGIVSWITRVPYVCFLRGWTKENRKVAFYEAIERWCLRSADRIVCLSELQSSRLSKLYRSRARVVVNAASIRSYTAEQRTALRQQVCGLVGLDPGRPLAVAAGRLSPEKGTAVLVECAAILRRSCPDLQFAIFGEGEERQRLLQQVSSLNLESKFKFAGHHGNFSDLVAGADLLVNPSFSEEIPNVVLEAMSAGVPVVATAVGGVPDLGRDGAIAMVKAGDADLLAGAIQEVVSDGSRSSAIVQKAWERLEQDYSPHKQAEQLRSLYEEFVAIGRGADGADLPRISVVIPVRNEEKRIATVLEDLREQAYPQHRFEIIVADGVSTDRTVDIVERLATRPGAEVRVVQNPGRLSSCGRNAGVAAASGDIIIFTDGHCHLPSRTLLRDAADLFARSGAGILCRPQPLDFPESTSFQRVVAAARASWLGHGRDSTIYNMTFEGWVDPSSAGAMYRRDLFEQYGGIDESFDACEDVEFNCRLHRSGVKAYISPKLAVYYEPRKSLSGLFRQMVRYGRGRVRLGHKHRGSGSLSQMAPAVLVAVLLAGVIAPFTPLFRPWLVLVASYLVVVVAESLRVAARRGGSKALLLPFVFIAIHTGLGTGLLLEWLLKPQRDGARASATIAKSEDQKESLQLSTNSSAQEIGTK